MNARHRLRMTLLLVATACRDAPPSVAVHAVGENGGTTVPGPPLLVLGDSGVMLVGAGDIAYCGQTADEETAKLLDDIPGTIFTAGDNTSLDGTAAEFEECYRPSWGRHRERIRPAPGNHEYNTPGAAGYFGFFGPAAGDPASGYYSYVLGAWHIVVLNSNIDISPSSQQLAWLRADLAASTAKCTLAYWHHPRFTSGRAHGSSNNLRPAWRLLYEAGADVVLGGHEHNYERFAPQTPDGAADPRAGIRQFTVGTGGAELTGFRKPAPRSEVRDASTHGVLQLALYPGHYEWRFVPIAGGTFTDSGSTTCH